MTVLMVASYNVHRCVGVDRKLDVDRVAEVVAELDADVVALQEVESKHCDDGRSPQLDRIAQQIGYSVIAGPTCDDRNGFGNAVLTRLPPGRVHRHDLSMKGREPRGAIDVDVEVGGSVLRIIATHFGLSAAERRTQCRQILDVLGDDAEMRTIVLGDFNEWRPSDPCLRPLNERMGAPFRVRTFPSRFPAFCLDRIWAQPESALVHVKAHATPLARKASDHLPVFGAVDMGR
jgi:endonuclease/exonuclease/phosphatase family metal-dependent hydrolase